MKNTAESTGSPGSAMEHTAAQLGPVPPRPRQPSFPPAAGGVATSTPAGGPKVPEGEENYQHSDSYYSDKMNSSQTGSMSGRPKVIVRQRKPTKQSEAPASKQDTELS